MQVDLHVKTVMVMYSAHATTHANRSKKNTFSRRTLPTTEGVHIIIPTSKSEIIGKDKNGNNKYPTTSTLPSPKQPVFAQRRMKRMSSQHEPMEEFTQEHSGLVEYLNKTWSNVKKEFEKKSQKPTEECGPVYYREKETNPKLQNFNTFDLDQWMEERLLAQLMKSS